jgi:hypothetical protein
MQQVHSTHSFAHSDLQLRLIPATTGLVLPPDFSMQPTSESGGLYWTFSATTS